MICLALLKALAETYDVYADLAGVDKNGQPVLLPIARSSFRGPDGVTTAQ